MFLLSLIVEDYLLLRVPTQRDNKCQPSWIIVAVYVLTLILSLSCASYDDMFSLYQQNKSLFLDQMVSFTITLQCCNKRCVSRSNIIFIQNKYYFFILNLLFFKMGLVINYGGLIRKDRFTKISLASVLITHILVSYMLLKLYLVILHPVLHFNPF